MDAVAPIDFAATLLFIVALLLALRIRTPSFDRTSRIFLALSLGVYTTVGAFNVLEHAGVTSYLDRFEDYLEIVFAAFFMVFLYSVHVGADLRRREEAEASLRESERQYRTLVEAVPHGILEYDLHGTIVFSNSAHARMLGYRPGELVGRGIAELAPTPEERAERTAYFERLVRDQPEPEPYFGRDRTAGGEVREVRLDWDYRRDSRGRPTGFVAVATDVTESRRIEEESERTQRLESLGVLAGGLAHDFNNLLTAILGNISLARLRAGSEEPADALLAEAERASLRARDLTQQLTTFAKGGEPLKRPVDLGRLIAEACSFALSGSNVRCEVRIPERLRPVQADEGQISQTLNNLLINAAQAMPEGGTITVACDHVRGGTDPALASREGEFVRIVVEDTGVGIPREHEARIFDPYFTTKERGTGLGLSTVYSIVKRHDGAIRVEPSPGGGTRFAVYLPVSAPGERPEEHLREQPHPAAGAGAGRILLMDDEAQVREVARLMISSLGYAVDVAEDGARAVEMYGEALRSGRPYAAVILDLTVPGGLGGKETIRRLLEIDPGVRAVVSSGYSDDTVMAAHRAHGFRAVVGKPYTVDELGRALKLAVSGEETP